MDYHLEEGSKTGIEDISQILKEIDQHLEKEVESEETGGLYCWSEGEDLDAEGNMQRK